MAFPELVTPGGIQVDGPAKGDLGRLFNAVVSVHGYKDGELDSVSDGEIAAAWMETAHEMAPPLEFQVRFANPASMAREFTTRLRILEARSPHGNPAAADRIEGEPTMLSRCVRGCRVHDSTCEVPRSATSCAQLTTSPSLSLSWPRPIRSKPEVSETALIVGLQAQSRRLVMPRRGLEIVPEDPIRGD